MEFIKKDMPRSAMKPRPVRPAAGLSSLLGGMKKNLMDTELSQAFSMLTGVADEVSKGLEEDVSGDDVLRCVESGGELKRRAKLSEAIHRLGISLAATLARIQSLVEYNEGFMDEFASNLVGFAELGDAMELRGIALLLDAMLRMDDSGTLGSSGSGGGGAGSSSSERSSSNLALSISGGGANPNKNSSFSLSAPHTPVSSTSILPSSPPRTLSTPGSALQTSFSLATPLRQRSFLNGGGSVVGTVGQGAAGGDASSASNAMQYANSSADSSITVKFASLLRIILTKGFDRITLTAAARALGRLGKSSDSASRVDFVRFETVRALEWLHLDAHANRRLAAVLVLRYLTEMVPMLFVGHDHTKLFFERAGSALFDKSLATRLAARDTLSAFFTLVESREDGKQSYFKDCYNGIVVQGIEIRRTPEAIHGSLLAVGELLRRPNDVLRPVFGQICNEMFRFRVHTDPLVVRAVVDLVPSLARFSSDFAIGPHMVTGLTFLIQCAKPRLEKYFLSSVASSEAALESLGLLVEVVGPHCNAVLDVVPSIVEAVRYGLCHVDLSQTALGALARLARVLGDSLLSESLGLLDDVFAYPAGLIHAELLPALDAFMPMRSARPLIRARLIHEIAIALTGQPFILPQVFSVLENAGLDEEDDVAAEDEDELIKSHSLNKESNRNGEDYDGFDIGNDAVTSTGGGDGNEEDDWDADDSYAYSNFMDEDIEDKEEEEDLRFFIEALRITGPNGQTVTSPMLPQFGSSRYQIQALKALGSFDFGPLNLIPFLHQHVSPTLSSKHPMRAEACLTCSQTLNKHWLLTIRVEKRNRQRRRLVARNKGGRRNRGMTMNTQSTGGGTSLHSSIPVKVKADPRVATATLEVCKGMLNLAVGDVEPSIRLFVMNLLYANLSLFGTYLIQSSSLHLLFTSINDSKFSVRLASVRIVAGLNSLNPGCVLPHLRKSLMGLVVGLKSSVVKREEVETASLLVELIHNLYHQSERSLNDALLRPFSEILVRELLVKIRSQPFATSTVLIKAVGAMADVSDAHGTLRGLFLEAFPIVVDAARDSGGTYKQREVALSTLIELVKETESIGVNVLKHKGLIDSLLEIVSSPPNSVFPWDLQREALRVLGTLGALDPSQLSASAFERNANDFDLSIVAVGRPIAKRSTKHESIFRNAEADQIADDPELHDAPVRDPDAHEDQQHQDEVDDIIVNGSSSDSEDSDADDSLLQPVRGPIAEFGSTTQEQLELHFRSVAVQALTKILRTPALASFHAHVVEAAGNTCRSLGPDTVPYLPKLVPAMIRVVVSPQCDPELRRTTIKQLTVFVQVLKKHMRPFLEDIFHATRLHWDDHVLEALSLVEEASLALREEFGVYINWVVPKLIQALRRVLEVPSSVSTASRASKLLGSGENNTTSPGNASLMVANSVATKGRGGVIGTQRSVTIVGTAGQTHRPGDVVTKTAVAGTIGGGGDPRKAQAALTATVALMPDRPSDEAVARRALTTVDMLGLWISTAEHSHRVCSEILAILDSSRASDGTKSRALEVLRSLCQRETFSMDLLPIFQCMSKLLSTPRHENSHIVAMDVMIALVEKTTDFSYEPFLELLPERFKTKIQRKNMLQQRTRGLLPKKKLTRSVTKKKEPLARQAYTRSRGTTQSEDVLVVRRGGVTKVEVVDDYDDEDDDEDDDDLMIGSDEKDSDIASISTGAGSVEESGNTVLLSTLANEVLSTSKSRSNSIASGSSLGNNDVNATSSGGGGGGGGGALTVNAQKLREAWEVTQANTEEDWSEWLRRVAVELLRESPDPTLRACASVAQAHRPLARHLFNAAFVSCWTRLSDDDKSSLVKVLKTVLRHPNTPSDVLHVLLNLCEFMEHNDRALPIENLSAYSSKAHAFAKALHYKELDFRVNKTTNVFDDLISINHRLERHEAAQGLVRIAQQSQQHDNTFVSVPGTLAGYSGGVSRRRGSIQSVAVEVKEIWYEQLGRWRDALESYEAKFSSTPSTQDVRSDWILGMMRCMLSLGEYDRLCDLGKKCWNTFDQKAKMAPLIAHALWEKGADAAEMQPYLSYLDDSDLQGALLKVVAAIQRGDWDATRLRLDDARRAGAAQLSTSVTESYARGYPQIVVVQQLAELEEVALFRQAQRKKRELAALPSIAPSTAVAAVTGISAVASSTSNDDLDTTTAALRLITEHNNDDLVRLRSLWEKRLKLCQKSVNVWQRILATRMLVVSPREDASTWIKFSSICRVEERWGLGRSILKRLGVVGDYDVEKSLRNGAPSDAVYAMLKLCWVGAMDRPPAGDRNKSLDALKILIDHVDRDAVHSRVRYHLTYGDWVLALNEAPDEQKSRNFAMKHVEVAKKLNPTSYKAAHAWASLNFLAFEHEKDRNAGSSISKAPLSSTASTHLTEAIRGYFASIALGRRKGGSTSSIMQDVLRLLTLWFEQATKHAGAAQAVREGFASQRIPVGTWLNVIPQLIARIQSNPPCLRELFVELGSTYPQALVYPLTVAARSVDPKVRGAAEGILSELRTTQAVLLDQAALVARELIRVAILLPEEWYEALEDACKAWFPLPANEGENRSEECMRERYRALKAMNACLADLNTRLGNFAYATRHEAEFLGKFEKNLQRAAELVQLYEERRGYEVAGKHRLMVEAWVEYKKLYSEIQERYLKELGMLELEDVSPLLLQQRNLQLAVPGTFRADLPSDELVTIKAFGPRVKVFTTKQRPRQLALLGSNDCTYRFLLKGHEDLRQDERAMQLFGLANALLSQAEKTFRKDLSIVQYIVIPLSPNVGLIGWLPQTDTLHSLIRRFRAERRIPLNIEQQWGNKIAPFHMAQGTHRDPGAPGNAEGYDRLTLIQKVEVFQYSLESNPGDDLSKAMWHKSANAEIWLDRRTNYTRSLATMSMVGYVLGLGDRHPSNLMIHRTSGRIVHIDFGDCFEVAAHREKYPERVPFRLTRMLINAMEISGIEGNFRTSCESVMSVLRTNRDSVLAMLEAFVHDPLISWRLWAQQREEEILHKENTPANVAALTRGNSFMVDLNVVGSGGVAVSGKSKPSVNEEDDDDREPDEGDFLSTSRRERRKQMDNDDGNGEEADEDIAPLRALTAIGGAPTTSVVATVPAAAVPTVAADEAHLLGTSSRALRIPSSSVLGGPIGMSRSELRMMSSSLGQSYVSRATRDRARARQLSVVLIDDVPMQSHRAATMQMGSSMMHQGGNGLSMSAAVSASVGSASSTNLIVTTGATGGVQIVEAHEPTLNRQAVVVVRRVKDKLTGTDFGDDVVLNVVDQVDKLIRQATSHENLCSLFVGWCANW